MSETMQIKTNTEYDANGETVEIAAENDGKLIVHHKDRTVEGQEYKAVRPRDAVEMTAEAENWEEKTSEVEHPEKFNTIACEVCGSIGHVGEAVDRQDQAGVHFACCPDCAGDYETVFVKQSGSDWVVTKANHHVISEHNNKQQAKREAERVGFNVEIL